MNYVNLEKAISDLEAMKKQKTVELKSINARIRRAKKIYDDLKAMDMEFHNEKLPKSENHKEE
jgi:hypothetical protein